MGAANNDDSGYDDGTSQGNDDSGYDDGAYTPAAPPASPFVNGAAVAQSPLVDRPIFASAVSSLQ